MSNSSLNLKIILLEGLRRREKPRREEVPAGAHVSAGHGSLFVRRHDAPRADVRERTRAEHRGRRGQAHTMRILLVVDMHMHIFIFIVYEVEVEVFAISETIKSQM